MTPPLPTSGACPGRSRSMLRSGRFWFAFIFAVVLLLPGLFLVGRTLYRLVTYETTEGSARYDARGRRGLSRYKIGYAVNSQGHALNESSMGWLGLGYQDGEKVKVLY